MKQYKIVRVKLSLEDIGSANYEKLEAVKKFLASTIHAKSLFSALGDTQQVAREKRALKRLKAWKGYFENEAKN